MSTVTGVVDPLLAGTDESSVSWWSRSRVRWTMAAVGIVQFAIITRIVTTSGFQQDDYLFFSSGHTNGFTVDGLTQSIFGSFIPGFNFVNTVLARTLPIHRGPAVLLTLAMYAALVFVFYRLLELLFGPRPVIVLLTAVATCSGLLGVTLVWWTPAINGLPALIADLLALDGLIRHALTGRVRYLVISVVSFAVGTLFYDPSMEVLVPLVLVVLLYRCDTWDRHSVWNAFRSRAWLWVGYLVPIVASFGWRLLNPGRYKEPPIGTIRQIAGFMVGGLTKGLTSEALGLNYLKQGTGFWSWGIIVIGQSLLVAVVVITIVRRHQAWRAWALFFLSFLAADLVAAIGRASSEFYAQFNSLYWCYFLFLFVVAFGLALLPSPLTASLRPDEPTDELTDELTEESTDEPTDEAFAPRRPRRALVGGVSVLVTAVLCALGIHYIWTTPQHALGSENRVYTQRMNNAWSAVSRANGDSFVWDTDVPGFVVDPVFSPFNKVAPTLGMVIGGIRIDAPAGRGYLITEAGALVPATGRVMASQVASSAAPGVSSSTACFGGAASRKLRVHLDHVVPRGRWFIRIHYTRSGGEVVELNYPGAVYLPKGSGTVLAHLPALSAVSTIVMTTKKPSTLCESANVETPVAAGR